MGRSEVVRVKRRFDNRREQEWTSGERTSTGSVALRVASGRPSLGGIVAVAGLMILGMGLVFLQMPASGAASVPDEPLPAPVATSGGPIRPTEIPAGALTWRMPDFGPGVGRAHDLCVDSDAIAAGLDGGALAQDREALGIDCADPASPMRYGFLTESGVLTLGASPEDAQAAARDLGSEDASPVDTGRPGLLLGVYPYVPVGTQAGVETVEVIPSSLSLADGTLRGLIRNRSESQFAVGVRVSDGVGSWVLPYALQPGEAGPFEIDDWPGDEPSDAASIHVEFTLTPSADLGRAFLIAGAPGYWQGAAKDFPGLSGILPVTPTGEFRYFESIVEVVSPEAPSVAAVSLTQVHALVTFFSVDGSVLDVVDMPLFDFDGGSTAHRTERAAPGGSYMVGFEIPEQAEDFMISIGGTP